MKESEIMRGAWTIEARDAASGRLVRLWKIQNTLTAINKTVRTDMLRGVYTGTADALQIHYFAFGDGTAAPTAADTQLGNERFRKQITKIALTADGNVQSVVSLAASEANFTIREIGVFCGPSATSESGSGTMISRAAVEIEHNSNIVLNFIRNDICTI